MYENDIVIIPDTDRKMKQLTKIWFEEMKIINKQ